MKCLLGATFVLTALTLLAEAGTTQHNLYTSGDCSGNPKYRLPVDVDECKRDDNRRGDYGYSSKHALSESATFARYHVGGAGACTGADSYTLTFACGKCVNSKLAVCNEGERWVREDQCNSDCSNCTRGTQHTIGQCTFGVLYVESFSTAPAVIKSDYATSDCSGAGKITEVRECDYCYQSAPNGGEIRSIKMECDESNLVTLIIIIAVVVVIVAVSTMGCYCCCCKKSAPQAEAVVVFAGAAGGQPVMVAAAGPQVVQMQAYPSQQGAQPYPGQQGAQPYPGQQVAQPYPGQQGGQLYPGQQASGAYPAAAAAAQPTYPAPQSYPAVQPAAETQPVVQDATTTDDCEPKQ